MGTARRGRGAGRRERKGGGSFGGVATDAGKHALVVVVDASAAQLGDVGAELASLWVVLLLCRLVEAGEGALQLRHVLLEDAAEAVREARGDGGDLLR